LIGITKYKGEKLLINLHQGRYILKFVQVSHVILALLFFLVVIMSSGCLDGGDSGDLFGLKIASESIPDPYYMESQRPMDKTIDEATRLFGVGFLKEYQLNRFDCSEMAAYLEWMLEGYGFDTKICISRSFQDQGGHAWLAIDLPVRRYYIEPTQNNFAGAKAFAVIQPMDDEYADYNNYDFIYDDIYDLTKNQGVGEFDWWNQVHFDEACNKHNFKNIQDF